MFSALFGTFNFLVERIRSLMITIRVLFLSFYPFTVLQKYQLNLGHFHSDFRVSLDIAPHYFYNRTDSIYRTFDAIGLHE